MPKSCQKYDVLSLKEFNLIKRLLEKRRVAKKEYVEVDDFGFCVELIIQIL